MRSIYIVYYTLKRQLKNKNEVIRGLIFTLLIILILGLSLKEAFTSDQFNQQNISVYSNKIEAFNSFQSYIASKPQYKHIIKLVKVNSNNVGIQNVKSEKSDVYIKILEPPNKSIEVEKVSVLHSNDFEDSFIKSLINSYRNSLGEHNAQVNVVKGNPLDLTSKQPNAMGYYSVTMIIMIMFYNCAYGANIVIEDRDKNKVSRIISLPISYRKHITCKIIGEVIFVFLEAIFLIMCTKFIYKANWGSKFVDIFLAMLLFSIFCITFGTALASIIKSEELISFILTSGIAILTFIAGGYVPIEYLNKTINNLSILSPSYAIQTIVFKNIYGYSYSVSGFYLELILLSIILFMITMVFGKEKEQ